VTLYLITGGVLGFSIAAPVGPIGLLCIRRSLTEGSLRGFVGGLGVATADAVFAFLGGIATASLAEWVAGVRPLLGIVGGLFLIYLGAQAMRTHPTSSVADRRARGALGCYLSMLALTLTNPMTILSFAAVFATLGAASSSPAATALLALGVFAGSAAWWLILCTLTGVARRVIGQAQMHWINRVSGLVIVLFGGYGLWKSLV